MATLNYRQGSVNHPASQLNKLFALPMTVDAGKDNVGSGDIAQLFDLLVGMRILDVATEIITPEGATLTIDVGITAVDADGFHDGFNGNAAAGTMLCSTGVFTASTTNANLTMAVATGLYRLQGGFFAAAADTLDALYNNASSTGKITYTMSFVDMRGVMAFGPTPV